MASALRMLNEPAMEPDLIGQEKLPARHSGTPAGRNSASDRRCVSSALVRSQTNTEYCNRSPCASISLQMRRRRAGSRMSYAIK